MAVSESKINKKRVFSAYVSSILSMTLVLLMMGVAALILMNAGNISDYFKEYLQVSVIFEQETTEKQAREYCAALEKEPYVKSINFVSVEDGIKEMQDLLGRDFLTVFDSAPIPVSLELSIKAEYVNEESMTEIIGKISGNKLVDEVIWQKSLIEALNSNLRKISLILSVFVVLMTFISLVLIANTVRLSLYGKRFTIHTMRLVGATKGFIAGPFLVEALFHGVIAALFAIIMLLGLLFFIRSEFALMITVFRLDELLCAMGLMVGMGIAICLSTTSVVVNKLINLRKEELYF